MATFVVLAGLALPGGAAAEVPAAERRCGDMGARAPDYHDVRAREVTCRRAKKVVLKWAHTFTDSVFERVEVGDFVCHGRRSKRRIGGVRTFYIRCVDESRVVRWWIRPFD
jgi:hypothetical protein